MVLVTSTFAEQCIGDIDTLKIKFCRYISIFRAKFGRKVKVFRNNGLTLNWKEDKGVRYITFYRET